MQNQTSPLILTFGATDPVGAIGIQADLAAFSAMGCHGLSTVTAILIGDTTGVEDIQSIDADWVSDQARVILEDMPVAAIKVGIPGSIENVAVIAEIVSDYPDIPLILDPFISALPDQSQEAEDLLIALRELLIPQTTVLFVSAMDMERFAEGWRETSTENTLVADAMELIEMGCEYVFVTNTPGDVHIVSNMLFDSTGMIRHDTWPRLPNSFHGAGTTLSAAITAMLANGVEASTAMFESQKFTNAALANAHRLGMGKLIPDLNFRTRPPADPVN